MRQLFGGLGLALALGGTIAPAQEAAPAAAAPAVCTGLACAPGAIPAPAAIEEAEAPVPCPFAPANPIRLARLLGVAGADAIRAEAPFRPAQSRLCAS